MRWVSMESWLKMELVSTTNICACEESAVYRQLNRQTVRRKFSYFCNLKFSDTTKVNGDTANFREKLLLKYYSFQIGKRDIPYKSYKVFIFVEKNLKDGKTNQTGVDIDNRNSFAGDWRASVLAAPSIHLYGVSLYGSVE